MFYIFVSEMTINDIRFSYRLKSSLLSGPDMCSKLPRAKTAYLPEDIDLRQLTLLSKRLMETTKEIQQDLWDKTGL